jgi:hypothetical protein
VGRFLNDFDQFIHGRGGWAERAADLGWDTLALFGCHPTRPLDHLNGAGLLWRISGGKITAMQSDWATTVLSVRHSGGHVQSGNRRVAQKICGNHSVR